MLGKLVHRARPRPRRVTSTGRWVQVTVVCCDPGRGGRLLRLQGGHRRLDGRRNRRQFGGRWSAWPVAFVNVQRKLFALDPSA